MIRGFIIGFIMTIFFFVFYLFWDCRKENKDQMSKNRKMGVYYGAFTSFFIVYSYLAIDY